MAHAAVRSQAYIQRDCAASRCTLWAHPGVYDSVLQAHASFMLFGLCWHHILQIQLSLLWQPVVVPPHPLWCCSFLIINVAVDIAFRTQSSSTATCHQLGCSYVASHVTAL